MVFIEHNSLKSDIFLIPYLFHVFQDSCFSGFRFLGSRFFRVQVFKGPGSSGTSFLRIRVQVLEVAEFKQPIKQLQYQFPSQN